MKMERKDKHEEQTSRLANRKLLTWINKNIQSGKEAIFPTTLFMKRPSLRFLAFLSIGTALSMFSARAQQDIPLSLETIGNSQRLVIYAGINGGVAEPYLFDTGSSGFNAAYYNGTYTGVRHQPRRVDGAFHDQHQCHGVLWH
jgi:hypothetical protein